MGVGAGQAGQATAKPIFLRKLLITKISHFKHSSHFAPCPTRHICLTNIKLPDQSKTASYTPVIDTVPEIRIRNWSAVF